jgi:Animal haem peroxidase.
VFILEGGLYVDRRRVDTPRGFPETTSIPSPNTVSQAVFEAQERNQGNLIKLSTLFMTTGQFLDHDVGLSIHGPCDVDK